MPFKYSEDRREYFKQWRKNNPELYIVQRNKDMLKQAIKRNSGEVNKSTLKARENKAILVEYKGGRCFDCYGVFPICCYDFDHLRDKSFEIGSALLSNIDKLKKEADKCELVCANCHRIRTQKRLNIG